MILIYELKRYFYLNLSKPRKLFLTIFMNLSIIIIAFQIFKEHVSEEYIFAYLMVWLFMSTYASMNVDLHTEMKNGRIKYYYIESDNNFINVYFCRYVLNLMKNIFIIMAMFYLLNLFGIINVAMEFTVFLLLFVEFVSIFGIFFVMVILECLFYRFKGGINLLLIIAYILMLMNTSLCFPLGGIANSISLVFLGLSTMKINYIYLILNSICYSFISYLISILISYKFRSRILNERRG